MLLVPRSYRKKQAKKNAYRREVPEMDSGQQLMTAGDMAKLWNSEKKSKHVQSFAEALALAGRYEGHEKMASQLMRRQAKEDNFDEKVMRHEEQLANKIVKENTRIAGVDEDKYITEQIEIIKEEEKKNAQDNKI